MRRGWLVIVAAIAMGAIAHAQVFKPRGTTPAKTGPADPPPAASKSTPPTKPAAKPAPKRATPVVKMAAKKPTAVARGSTKPVVKRPARSRRKLSRAADDARPDDLTPDPVGKRVTVTDDDDDVTITDDD
jgi:hypothetical protein